MIFFYITLNEKERREGGRKGMGQEEKKKCVRKKTDGQTQEKTGVEM